MNIITRISLITAFVALFAGSLLIGSYNGWVDEYEELDYEYAMVMMVSGTEYVIDDVNIDAGTITVKYSKATSTFYWSLVGGVVGFFGFIGSLPKPKRTEAGEDDGA